MHIELVLAALVGGFVLFYSLLVPSSDTAALALVAFSVLFVVVEVFFQAAAKGAQDFRAFSQASLIGGFLFGAAAITIVSLGYGIYPLLFAYIGRRILTILLIGWQLPNHYTLRNASAPTIPLELRRRILRYSRDIVLIFATSTISLRAFWRVLP